MASLQIEPGVALGAHPAQARCFVSPLEDISCECIVTLCIFTPGVGDSGQATHRLQPIYQPVSFPAPSATQSGRLSHKITSSSMIIAPKRKNSELVGPAVFSSIERGTVPLWSYTQCPSTRPFLVRVTA